MSTTTVDRGRAVSTAILLDHIVLTGMTRGRHIRQANCTHRHIRLLSARVRVLGTRARAFVLESASIYATKVVAQLSCHSPRTLVDLTGATYLVGYRTQAF